MKKLILLSLVTLLLYRCQEPELTLGPTNLDDRKYLLEDVYDPVTNLKVEAYEYDAFDRLMKQDFRTDGIYLYEFLYDGPEARNPYLIKGSSNGQLFKVYLTYDDDKLIESRYVTPTLENLLYLEQYKYDKEGKMTGKTVFPGIFMVYHEVSYEWDMGNVIKETYVFDEFTEVRQYDFDARPNRRNPYVRVYRHIGYDHFRNIPVSANNWANKIVTIVGEPKMIVTSKSLFSYNIGGFPYYAANETENQLGEKTDVRRKFLYLN